MGSFIDVSEADLVRIYDLARHHAQERHPGSLEIQPGRCYSNGRYGADRAVRSVSGLAPGPDGDLLCSEGVAGAGWRTCGTATGAAVIEWARDETTWRRVQRRLPSEG